MDYLESYSIYLIIPEWNFVVVFTILLYYNYIVTIGFMLMAEFNIGTAHSFVAPIIRRRLQ